MLQCEVTVECQLLSKSLMINILYLIEVLITTFKHSRMPFCEISAHVT
jgi:hypothetical protein